MAIGGDNVQVFHLRVQDGRLIQIGGLHVRPKHLSEGNIDNAVAALKRGEVVMLRSRGDNLATVKERLKAIGVAI